MTTLGKPVTSTLPPPPLPPPRFETPSNSITIYPYGFVHEQDLDCGDKRIRVYLFDDIGEISFHKTCFYVYGKSSSGGKGCFKIIVAISGLQRTMIRNSFLEHLDKRHKRQSNIESSLMSIDKSLNTLQEQIEFAPGNKEFMDARERQIHSVGISE
jgi:hypothetical protein